MTTKEQRKAIKILKRFYGKYDLEKERVFLPNRTGDVIYIHPKVGAFGYTGPNKKQRMGIMVFVDWVDRLYDNDKLIINNIAYSDKELARRMEKKGEKWDVRACGEIYG